MNAVLTGLASLGAARLAAMAAVAAAMLGLLTVLALRGSGDRMVLLYGDLDLREAAQIAEALDRQKLAHQVGLGGTQILVPAEQVARDRLLLAKDGLPTGGSLGYEIFDRGDNLTASQFQQGINQARALEGELARSIRTLQGIKGARVHIVLGKREPFARDRQDAQASIVITMAGIARLDQEGTRAILNLVAAAVPGLRPQNIAIVDTRGNVLARTGEVDGAGAVAQTHDDLRRASELRIARAVEEMLERSVGPGRVRAEANITFDFDQTRETQERYDPDGQVVRSAQSVTNSSKSTEAAGNVSVQNNLPNADAGNAQPGTQEQRQEETTNYEIAKTIRTIVHDQPRILRISLGIMVDGVSVRAADGTLSWQERPAQELDRIARLARSAIGFDEKRGDKVDVVTMRFAQDLDSPDLAQTSPLVFGLDRADVMRLGQSAVFGVLGLLTLLLVLRPAVSRLTTAGPSLALAGRPVGGVPALAGDPQMGFTEATDGGTADAGFDPAAGPQNGVSRGRIEGGGSAVALLEDESMVNISNVEGQLRASSIRRIANLVEKHPEESLAIMRAWMHQEG